MKCPNCKALVVNGNFCTKCGARLPKDTAILNVDNPDPLLIDAAYAFVKYNKASIGMLQRIFKIGFNRAAHIWEQLYEIGVVCDSENRFLPPVVAMSKEELDNLFANNIKEPTIEVTTDVDKMSGKEFESYCSLLLEKNNFTNIKLTQDSGDHGIDILAEKDDVTYAIQCKCYSSSIGNSAVQQAHTGKSIYHKDIAVVLTNQYFTSQAIEEANILGVKLWDRDKLFSLINKSNMN